MVEERARKYRVDDAAGRWSVLLVNTAHDQGAIVKIIHRQYNEAKSKSSRPFHWMIPLHAAISFCTSKLNLLIEYHEYIFQTLHFQHFLCNNNRNRSGS